MKLNLSGKSVQVVTAAKKTARKAPQVLRDEGGVKGGAGSGGNDRGKAPAKPGR